MTVFYLTTRPSPGRSYTTSMDAALSLSLGGTYALVRSGTIPALKLGGRWVIPKKRFHAWLDATLPPNEPETRGA